MAKDIIREHYIIHARTSVEMMGKACAELTKLGITDVTFELMSEVETWHGNSERKVHEVNGQVFTIESFLPTRSAFKSADLVKFFEEDGRTAGSAYQVLKVLTEAGIVNKIDKATYEVAPKRLPPPTEAEATPEPAAGEHRKTFETTGKEEIMKFIKNRSDFNTKQLRELFEGQGRKPNAVSPILTELMEEKLIKHTGRPFSGEYVVLKRATVNSHQQKSTNHHGVEG